MTSKLTLFSPTIISFSISIGARSYHDDEERLECIDGAADGTRTPICQWIWWPLFRSQYHHHQD